MRLPNPHSIVDFEVRFHDESWDEAAERILQGEGLSGFSIKRLDTGDHIVYSVSKDSILKIFNGFSDGFNREKSMLELLSGSKVVNVPKIFKSGNLFGYDYLLLGRIPGRTPLRAELLKLGKTERNRFLDQLANSLRSIHETDASGLPNNWDEFVAEGVENTVQRQRQAGVNPAVVDALPGFLASNLPILDQCETGFALHGDVHLRNLHVEESASGWNLTGLFDFADSRVGPVEYDFLAPTVLIFQGLGKIQRDFFRAYGYEDSQIDEGFRRKLMLLTVLYESSNLRNYAKHLAPEATDYSLQELELGIWNFA
ncbi:MAG: aminoglycoside phosphotransferase family protein [Pyrinomonadaceae bacterium]